MSELVQRLRNSWAETNALDGDLLPEAAAHIEQLEARVKQLIAESDGNLASAARFSNMKSEAENEVKTLKALLLKARDEVEYWTPDESNANADESEQLNNWYALRDEIDFVTGYKR